MTSNLPSLAVFAAIAIALLAVIGLLGLLLQRAIYRPLRPILRQVFRVSQIRRLARGLFLLDRVSRRERWAWYAATGAATFAFAHFVLDMPPAACGVLVALPLPLVAVRTARLSPTLVLLTSTFLTFLVSIGYELLHPIDYDERFANERPAVEQQTLAKVELKGFAADAPTDDVAERYLARKLAQGRAELLDDFDDGDLDAPGGTRWMAVASLEDVADDDGVRGAALAPLAGGDNLSDRFGPTPNTTLAVAPTTYADGSSHGHQLDVVTQVRRYTDYRATHGAYNPISSGSRRVRLQGVAGVLLRARGSGTGSIFFTLSRDGDPSRAPFLMAMLPLTDRWRTFFIPLENFQVGFKREFQDARIDGATIAGVYLLDAAHWPFGAESLATRFQVDTMALLHDDPVASGELVQRPGFAGLGFPGEGAAPPVRPRQADDASESFRNFGLVYHDGEWENDGRLSRTRLAGGDTLVVEGEYRVRSPALSKHLDALASVDVLVLLDRFYGADGAYVRSENVGMSTWLTVTGAPIQNMNIRSFMPRDGGPGSGPVGGEAIVSVPRSAIVEERGDFRIPYRVELAVPADLPAGVYRPRMHVYLTLREEASKLVASRDVEDQLSLFNGAGYLAKTLDAKPVSGIGFSSAMWDRFFLPAVWVGDPAPPRMVWTMLARYSSQSTRGVVAEEDRHRFQYGFRNAFQSRLVLPRTGPDGSPIAYDLGPDFPIVMQERLSLLEGVIHFQHPDDREGVTIFPLDYRSGEVSVKLDGPDGSRFDLGTHPFRGPSFTGASTGDDSLRFVFPAEGEWTAHLSGYIDDIFGTRYPSGGTFRFFVGHQLTFSTGVKPGNGFFVGESYPSLVEVHPPCPAEVRIAIDHYPGSDPARHQHVEIAGRANRFGYFNRGPETPTMAFNDPGEYTSEVTARYRDDTGRWWFGSQSSFGVASPRQSESPLVVRGGRIMVSDYYGLGYPAMRRVRLEREGFFQRWWDDESYSINYRFPFYSGDVLYVGSDLSGMNLLKATLSAEWNPDVPHRLLSFGLSHTDSGLLTQLFWGLNRMRTRTGRDAFSFPEERDVSVYHYASAIRPGLVPSSSVSDGTLIFDYWETNPNSFGGQINAGANGDMPGDVYKFFGGGVRLETGTGRGDYGNYASSAVILPRGSHANRVVAPLHEPMLRVAGEEYVNLFGVAVGVILETGDRYVLGGTVLPTVTGRCEFTIVHPDGSREERTGTGNDTGRCRADRPLLDVDRPGLYRIRARICQGKPEVCGGPTGAPDGWYDVYAVPRDGAIEVPLDVPEVSDLPLDQPEWRFAGHVPPGLTDVRVRYTTMMPGIHMDQGEIAVAADGSFTVKFVPDWFSIEFTNFEVTDHFRRKRALDDTVVVAIYLEGRRADTGAPVYGARRLHMRGSTLYALRSPPPATSTTAVVEPASHG